MRKIYSIISIILLLLIGIGRPAYAFWMWTPETNKWVNPKFAVKETPKEQLDYALEFYQVDDYNLAVRELKKLIKHFPRAREAADAQFYIAEIKEKQGELMAAFKSYQEVLEKYPFSEKSADIVKKQYEIGEQFLQGNDSRSTFVKTMVGGDHDVIEIFRTVIKNAPYGELAAPSQYKIALYLQEKHLYQEARDEFEKTVNDYSDSEWAQAARYQIAISDAKRSSDAPYDQKVTEAAINELKDFVKEYPDAELAKPAKDEISKLRAKEAEKTFIVAEFYRKQKKYDAAKIYYEKIIDSYGNTPWKNKAAKQLRSIERALAP